MQPIILLAIAGVAIAGLSTGFLMQNEIDLSMVQLLGVGETDIGTPITKANVDFQIGKIEGVAFDINGNAITVFKNVISACLVENNWQSFKQGEKIICKLTDANNNVVIEGMVTATTDPPDVIVIPILDPTAVLNSINNIHDIIIVVKGVPQTGTGGGP